MNPNRTVEKNDSRNSPEDKCLTEILGILVDGEGDLPDDKRGQNGEYEDQCAVKKTLAHAAKCLALIIAIQGKLKLVPH